MALTNTTAVPSCARRICVSGCVLCEWWGGGEVGWCLSRSELVSLSLFMCFFFIVCVYIRVCLFVRMCTSKHVYVHSCAEAHIIFACKIPFFLHYIIFRDLKVITVCLSIRNVGVH